MSMIAGGVAHDLNNTLGPLLALPAAIREDLNSGANVTCERFMGDLELLNEAAQHAAHTIRDLLTLGRTIDAPTTVYDVNAILASERLSFAQLAKRTEGVRLNLITAEQALHARVSREHLVRAVFNLIANAADAMTGPGEVVARVLRQHVVEPLHGVLPIEPGQYVVIEVQDTGCGIPEKDLPHIFEPFFSSKSDTARGGTGLGLAIAHQIVRQSGGNVHVQSRIGEGTTVALYLPLVNEAGAVESAPPEPALGGSERVLVVDDEQLQLRTAQRLLKQLGYQVWTANSGTAALELFAQHLQHEPFEVVILDVMMPGSLNGLETLRELRKMHPTQKALLASGFTPERLERNAAEQATHWLAKPYSREALAKAVRDALNCPVQPQSDRDS
jgi:CheY-like chemotaxis protein